MNSKLLQGELQYENGCNYYPEIPSYRMQTISSRLKIVAREEDRQPSYKMIVPFTVGSAFTTHNVMLLKQETLQKLKTMVLSYRNENVINSSTINELRLLKNDIDSFHFESHKLKYFASRRKQFLKTASSRYLYCIGRKDQMYFRDHWQPSSLVSRRKEKLNTLREENDKKKELVDFVKLQNRLETLFRKNKSNTKLSNYKYDLLKKQNAQEVVKQIEQENFMKQKMQYENPDTISRESSEESINRRSLSGKSVNVKKVRISHERKSPVAHREQTDYIEDESVTTMMDQRMKLLGEMSPIEITNQLAEMQRIDMGTKNFAPSIYSRKKRRKHVRKYYPSENIQEQNDEGNDDSLQPQENKISADGTDESQSNNSVTNRRIRKITNAVEVRPQTQPIADNFTEEK